jgi:hypothetical protein
VASNSSFGPALTTNISPSSLDRYILPLFVQIPPDGWAISRMIFYPSRVVVADYAWNQMISRERDRPSDRYSDCAMGSGQL